MDPAGAADGYRGHPVLVHVRARGRRGGAEPRRRRTRGGEILLERLLEILARRVKPASTVPIVSTNRVLGSERLLSQRDQSRRAIVGSRTVVQHPRGRGERLRRRRRRRRRPRGRLERRRRRGLAAAASPPTTSHRTAPSSPPRIHPRRAGPRGRTAARPRAAARPRGRPRRRTRPTSWRARRARTTTTAPPSPSPSPSRRGARARSAAPSPAPLAAVAAR